MVVSVVMIVFGVFMVVAVSRMFLGVSMEEVYGFYGYGFYGFYGFGGC